MKNKRSVLVMSGLAVLVAAAFGSGYWASRARAAGVPASMAMTYSGVLTDAGGTPLTGSKMVLFQLYDVATGGTAQCTVGPTALTLSAGAFQLPLPDTCASAVHSMPNLWAEVFVDNQTFGRSKLGAVPYALEADSASNAVGALAQAVAKIPTIQVNSSGYVACQPLNNFGTAGYHNLLVRARIFTDGTCSAASEVTHTNDCHAWCAAQAVNSMAASAAGCCGVAVYYTNGVVDVLQWK
jgi:hypothetical protein